MTSSSVSESLHLLENLADNVTPHKTNSETVVQAKTDSSVQEKENSSQNNEETAALATTDGTGQEKENGCQTLDNVDMDESCICLDDSNSTPNAATSPFEATGGLASTTKTNTGNHDKENSARAGIDRDKRDKETNSVATEASERTSDTVDSENEGMLQKWFD